MDGLTTWRDGPAKRAIVEFVVHVYGGDGREAVPVDDRVAVFDNDGTLWCEQPMPIQLDFILRRLLQMAEPDAVFLRERQPWKAAYERDHRWLSAVPAEHYAGNETNVKILAGGWRAPFAVSSPVRHRRWRIEVGFRRVSSRRLFLLAGGRFRAGRPSV